MLTGERPEPPDLILPGCHLTSSDIEAATPD